MDTAVETLPDDPVLLRAMLLEMMAEKQQLLDENTRLEQMLSQLRRMQFGKRSEKLDPDQFNLALEDVEQAVAQAAAEEEKRNPAYKRVRSEKRRAGRGSLPDHLPRIDVVIEPEEKACPCCGGAMHVIGEDQAQRLDVIPAQYRVIVTHRPKYACRACEGKVVQAAAPAHLIEGGLPTERLVASVLVAKYADHTPLYRQAQILARQGITIERKTLAFWVGYAAAEMKPLWHLMRDDLLGSTKIFVDETKAPVLDPGRGRTKIGYFWAIARDDRPWGGGDPPMVIYTYAPGRGGKHANTLLATFRGVLQADGYQVYKSFALAHDAVTVAHCWAHARREFFDVSKPSPIAEEAMVRIAAFYRIEDEIRGQSAEVRRAVRQEKTKPLVEAFKMWCEATLAMVSGKASIAGAIRYTLNQWEGLTRFLDDGRIEMDNNTVERCMRPIALNRKNALFAGHDEGAANWALIASLIETCKLNSVNPQTYLTDVLTKLVNNWPNSRLAELTPWAWGASHPI
jgi:transposase